MGIGPVLGGIGGLMAGGSSLLSGLFGGGGSGNLSDAIEQASQLEYQAQMAAINEMRQELAQARQYEQPFYTAGTGALGQFQNMLGLGTPGYDATAALSATPGYQFMLGQGVNALDRSAAAKGMLTSGAAGKGLMNFGQNLALTKAYAPYMSNLQSLIGGGQNAAALQGGWGLSTGQNIGNLLTQSGQTQANAVEQVAMANMLGGQQNWNRAMGGLGIISGTLSNPSFTNALSNMWGGV
jgi:hypothetical protein